MKSYECQSSISNALEGFIGRWLLSFRPITDQHVMAYSERASRFLTAHRHN